MPIALILFVALTGLEIVILACAASTGRIPSVGGAMVARADMAGTY